MSAQDPWKTSITEIDANMIRVRGYEVADLMETLSFSDAIFLVLKGELPTQAESEMMRAILVSSVDHGVSPPSVLAARTVMSAGNSLNAAIAGGVLAIGDVHGGAIENSAKLMQEWAAKDGTPEELAKGLVAMLREKSMRMPGYGHRLHTADPRTAKLFEIAERNDFNGKHLNLALAIERELESSLGKNLPLNVDGAIAAAISDLGFDWQLGKAFFIFSRVAGLAAHAYEEKTTQRPMRKLGDTNSQYVGASKRELPTS